MSLTRRRFLRGAGALIALPALEAIPIDAHATTPNPRRHVHVFGPNGAPMAAWTPTSTGAAYTLPTCLAPLAPVRDDLMVISGLDNVDGPAVHTFRTRSMLAERLPNGPYGSRFGRTLDQVIAPHLRATGGLASLQVASEGATGCASQNCHHLYTVSWTGEHTASPRDVHPRAVFERLWGGTSAGEDATARAIRLRQGRSVLDAVLGDLSHLQRTLPAADTARLDRYLTGVRALEQELTAPTPAAGTCDGGAALVDSTDPEVLTHQMIQLITLALACDRTRVLSWMVGSAESYRPLAFLGRGSDHHTVSHHDPTSHTAATTWLVDRYAALVASLAAEVQPDGRRLLDDCYVLYTASISDAPTHDHRDLPVLLAGTGGTALQTGRHVALPAGTPLAGLAMSFLQAYGVPATSFGLDGTASALDLTA